MTYPLIGNYGVTGRDRESAVPWVAGLIVREYYEDYSNCYAERSLGEMLEKAGVPAVSGVDTRAITRRIRTSGTMRGVLLQGERRESPEEMIAMAQAVPSVSQIDAVGDTVGALAGLEYEPGPGRTDATNRSGGLRYQMEYHPLAVASCRPANRCVPYGDS